MYKSNASVLVPFSRVKYNIQNILSKCENIIRFELCVFRIMNYVYLLLDLNQVRFEYCVFMIIPENSAKYLNDGFLYIQANYVIKLY